MNNRLTPIIVEKQKEVAKLKEAMKREASHPLTELLKGKIGLPPRASFKQALKSQSFSIIAEIKRKSPSKGRLAEIADPLSLAKIYQEAGAKTISVLTDETFFGGSLDDLAKLAQAKELKLPLLRKDFIIDELQIAQAALAGASAVLFITSVLGSKLKDMLAYAQSLNLEALVEVHQKEELDLALDCGAEILGINNRDLKTFSLDPLYGLSLLDLVPRSLIRVAESGLERPELVRLYIEQGVDAALIGEALVKSGDPGAFIKACHHPSSESLPLS